MKYKRICLLAVVLCLVFAFAIQGIETPNNRYHQHLQAAKKAACTDHGEETFCTHLPLLSITTEEAIPAPYLYDSEGNILLAENGTRVGNDEMVAATISCFLSETENNHLDDVPTLEERGLIRIRGASSRDFEKNGYLLKFTEEDCTTRKNIALCGMTADSTWVLHGPYLDKSLIRNYVCYNLAGEIMDYSPNVRFCELFLNGEYQGVYLLTEKIGQNDDGRIDITETDPELTTTAYIIRADRGATDESYALKSFGSYTYLTAPYGADYGQMEIVYPSSTLTEAQHDYILSDFSKFEKALYSFDYNQSGKGYEEYIDVDSFVDYFLINELTLNYDAPTISTYLYKELDGKLKLCVWDFNSAFDYYKHPSASPQTFYMQTVMWYRYLFKDDAFVERVIERYETLRKKWFSEEYLLNYIDETIAYLGDAIDRNFEKWGYTFAVEYDHLEPEERNVRSYEEAIEQLQTCISERIAYMDENIDRLGSLCHASVNKKYNYDSSAGGMFE